jgi:integrase
MSDLDGRSLTIAAFVKEYENHLSDVRGLAPATCKLHLRVVRNLVVACFGFGEIVWPELRFSHLVEFLTKEFNRLPNHWTQKVWLMIIRCFVRYLASGGHIPIGWDAALPKLVNRKHASLPRFLSQEQTGALWQACRGERPRDLRDRALLLLFTRLGLRTEEVAGLTLADIDWKGGEISIRATKTRRDRTLPLPWDVGEGLIAHLRVQPPRSPWLFVPRRPPFKEKRSYDHVRNSMVSLFKRAGLGHARLHSLRHYAGFRTIPGEGSLGCRSARQCWGPAHSVVPSPGIVLITGL